MILLNIWLGASLLFGALWALAGRELSQPGGVGELDAPLAFGLDGMLD